MKLERKPTTDELVLIDWLLQQGSCDYNDYRHQLPRLWVVRECECGCPTIELDIEGEAVPDLELQCLQEIAHVTGKSPEGAEVGVMLLATNGKLACLEIYPFEDAKISLPRPTDLRPRDELDTPVTRAEGNCTPPLRFES